MSTLPEFDGYDVLDEIARGSQAIVYRARGRDGRDVAIKLLNSLQRGAFERFCREERLHTLLRKEAGFVPLVGSGTSKRGPYLVTAFIDGGTLRQRMRGPMPVEDVVDVGRVLAEALGRAHAHGIVHRDLKPENVLLEGTGRPLIADLGLAKHFDSDTPGASQSVAITRDGGLIGTVCYMAPEQALDPRDVGAGADVFSLGCILYECLTGVEAFSGDTVADVLRKILGRAGPITPIVSLRPDAPPALVAVIERMLERDPRARFADGAAAAAALRALYRPVTTTRAVIAALVGAVLGMALLAVSLAVFQSKRPPAPVAVERRPDTPDVSPPASSATTAPTPSAARTSIEGAYRAIAPTSHTVLRAMIGEPKAGHSGSVRAVAFSAAGKNVRTLGDDGTLRTWDLATGQQVGVLPGAVTSGSIVAMSPDGERAVVRSSDRTIAILDVAGRAPVRALGEENVSSRSVHFTPDGLRVVRLRRGGELVVLELESGASRTLSIGSVRSRGATALAGSIIALALENGDVAILDLAGVEKTVRLGTSGPAANVLAFLGAGERLVVGREDGTLELWLHAGAPRLLRSIRSARATTLACWGGSQVYAGGEDGSLRAFDIDADTAAPGATIHLHQGAILAVAVSADGSRVLTGGADGTARLTDIAHGAELDALGTAASRIVTLATSRDGTVVLAGRADGSIVRFDASSGRADTRLAGSAVRGRGAHPVLSPDGSRALVGAETRPSILDVASGEIVPLPLAGGDALHGVAFSQDGRRFVVATDEGIRAFDAASGRLAQEIAAASAAEAARCWVLGVRRDARVVALGPDHTVRIFDLETGKSVAALASNAAALPVALSPEGARLLGATRREAPAPGGEGGREGGRESARGSESLVLWDLPTGVKLRELKSGRPGFVTALAFSPDGWRAVSVGSDRMIRLWDLGTGTVEDTIDLGPGDDRPGGICFSPDGHSLWVGTARGVLLRFELVEPR